MIWLAVIAGLVTAVVVVGFAYLTWGAYGTLFRGAPHWHTLKGSDE